MEKLTNWASKNFGYRGETSRITAGKSPVFIDNAQIGTGCRQGTSKKHKLCFSLAGGHINVIDLHFFQDGYPVQCLT